MFKNISQWHMELVNAIEKEVMTFKTIFVLCGVFFFGSYNGCFKEYKNHYLAKRKQCLFSYLLAEKHFGITKTARYLDTTSKLVSVINRL